MMNSTTLQITTQAVGGETLLGTFRQGRSARSYPSNIGRRFSSRCKLYTTRECGLSAASSPPGSAGHRWPRPLRRWPGLAYTASGARFTDMYTYSQQRYRYLTGFAHIHVDLVGPLPPSRGHTYLFTIIDRTSRWPEAIPLAFITAADCARALFAGWVSRFGVPVTITSDRGAQFTSALWAGLCSVQPTQHPALAHDSILPSVKRIGRVVPQAAEGRLAVSCRRRRLARPPPLGAAGYQSRLQRGQRIFTSRGGVRLAADSAWTVHQHRRVAVAVLPQRAADHDDRPPTTAGTAQRSPSPIHTT
jgi:hypothetical protein